MQYDIISATTLPDIINRVNNKIAQGWKPQGGLCTIDTQTQQNYGPQFFYQAMVTEDGNG